MARESAPFRFQPQAVVTSVQPPMAPEQEFTTVMVSGAHFADSSRLMCKFGSSVAVQARWYSPSLIQCVTPKLPAGSVALEVTNNAQDFSSSDVRVRFQTTVVINGVAPLHGPVDGGTVVNIAAANLRLSSTLLCRFDQVEVPATLISK